MKLTTKKFAFTAIFVALTAAITMISLPMGGFGYIHVGDSIIILATFLLGPLGMIAGALGATLADIILGYFVYVPATLIAKTLLALIGWAIIKKKASFERCFIGFLLGELAMQAVYFLFDLIVFGNMASGLMLLGLMIQPLASLPIGLLLIKTAKRFKLTI